MIRVNEKIDINENEILFSFSKSAGPGGQNVNKVNTKVTAIFNIAESRYLAVQDKKRILRKLASRINKKGQIRVISQKHRTQKANKNTAIERLTELLQKALVKKTLRRKTAIPRSAREKRLDQKKQRGVLKKQRSSVRQENDF